MNTRRNKHLLLWTSLATLLLLVYAAFEENVLREWRGIQRRYQQRLPAAEAADFNVQLRQVYAPALKATDRCITCHVGMAPGEKAIAGVPLYTGHPPVVHEPSDFGCVVCHGGQGRATEKADAHGTVPHWPEPMIPMRYAYAGCGTCHTHLAVPNVDVLARGRTLFERYDCFACHRVDGRGGTLRPGGAGGIDGPDLSRSGAHGFDAQWYEHHLDKHAAAADGPWRTSFGEITPDEREAMRVFLSSRVGAPGLVESKALFHSLGCRGCHKVGGVGGDDGPDLSREGEKDPGRLDFTHVPGDPTLANWLGEHFRAPAKVVPGSQMPYFRLTEEQIQALTFYLLSLRRTEFPEALWPKDRIRAARFAEREFTFDGATVFGTFCAACHGQRGQGMRYPGMASFPAIGNPDFLAVASDRFLTETVTHGRPGRRMPLWGEKEGGLRPAEITAVVQYVRSFADGAAAPTDPGPSRWVQADPKQGAHLFGENCAFCHGPAGEGREGPALHNKVLLASATDTYLVETIKRGRRGTSMPSFAGAALAHRQLSEPEIQSIVAFIRTWEAGS